MELKISKHQEEIIKDLKKGLFIWTNEGKELRAWIGNEKGEKVKSLKVITVSNLLKLNIIEFQDGDYKDNLYKYSLKNSIK